MDEKTLSELPDDEYLTREELLHLHGILTQQLEELHSQAREALGTLTPVREVEADEVDLASSELDREATLRFADRERRLLSKIEDAFDRMQDGEYGVCETCGAPISYKRLLARPVATQCIDCKTQAEQIERRSRRM